MDAIMDRSTLRSPDPGPGLPDGERRRAVRQKLHSPVYASFNGPEKGMVVDLSELLDLHEDGFSVQTNEKLEMNRALSLCLDLPETRSYVHGIGQVVWSDASGRGGIRFSSMPEKSRRILKEWLFANLLIGCANHAARAEQLGRQEQEFLLQRESDRLEEQRLAEESSAAEQSVYSLSTIDPETTDRQTDEVSSIETVRDRIRERGDDPDAVFHVITEAALRFTAASGAALAFLTDGTMLWRGQAGEPAPPMGASVDVQHGLTGECVRSGLLITCDDMESDPRVDPEVGRSLGIGSLMAAPIVFDFSVVGILEVFSPHAHNFTKAHKKHLHQLIEMIPQGCLQTSQPHDIRSGLMEAAAGQNSSLNSGIVELARPELNSEERSPMAALIEAIAEERSPARSEAGAEGKPDTFREQSRHDVFRGVEEEAALLEENAVHDGAESIAKREPTNSLPLLHRALMGVVIVVITMVVGYLIGPVLEKRWASAPHQPSRAPVKSSDGSASRRTVKSVAELQSLALQGDADAEWQLGVRYHNGEGVPHDDAQAVQWFLRAAEQGQATAQATLGAYYWAGRGVAQDLSRAYFWSAIALADGDENSKSRLEGLATQMSKSQVAVARQQAEIWLRSHNERAKSETN
jgi:hypothetical protein